MPFVSAQTMLQDAYQQRYAVGAFAVHNLEIVKAVVETAESLAAPVILQTTPSTIRYLGIKQTKRMVQVAAEEACIPVALHLDHGDSFAMICQCLREGYTSVMIDASDEPFSENVRQVQKVVEVAHAVGVPVEAEIGTVGQAADMNISDDPSNHLTGPQTAKDFATKTGIDTIAPAFGTAHGVYNDEPHLDIARLKEITNLAGIPVVMHGASGVPRESVRAAVRAGVSKVNFSTELKLAFADELRNYLNENPNDNDPRKYFIPARQKVAEIVKQKIEMIQPSKECAT